VSHAGGVHFNSSNVDGLKLGRLVAGELFDSFVSGGGKKGAAAAAKTPAADVLKAVTGAAAAKPAVGGRRLLGKLLQFRW